MHFIVIDVFAFDSACPLHRLGLATVLVFISDFTGQHTLSTFLYWQGVVSLYRLIS